MTTLEEITDLCDAYRDGSISEAEARQLVRLWYDPRTRSLVDGELDLQGAMSALCGSAPALRPPPAAAAAAPLPTRALPRTPHGRGPIAVHPRKTRAWRAGRAAVLLGAGVVLGTLATLWLRDRPASVDGLPAQGQRPLDDQRAATPDSIPIAGGRLRLAAGTQLEPPTTDGSWQLHRGRLQGELDPGSRGAHPLEIRSPHLALRVTGTVFDLEVGETSEARVLSGTVEAEDGHGRRLRLGAGDRCRADATGFLETPQDWQVLLHIDPDWPGGAHGGDLSAGVVTGASLPLPDRCFRALPRTNDDHSARLWVIEWQAGGGRPLVDLPPGSVIEALVRITGETDYIGWYAQPLDGSQPHQQFSGAKRRHGTDGWELWRVPIEDLRSKEDPPRSLGGGPLGLIQLHASPGKGVRLECAWLRVVAPTEAPAKAREDF